MKRKILIGLLAMGTVGGFAAGFGSMRCRAEHRRERFEHHVASVCVEAARDADRHERRHGDGPSRSDDEE
jgi:hypothetical protein